MRETRVVAVVALAVACSRPSTGEGERARPSSSAPSAKPDACATGGGTLDDPARAGWFPAAIAGLCVDPHAEFRSYGEGAKAPLGAACTALEGDCAKYARFGFRRALVVPYVSGADSRTRVTVTLLELAAPEAAYALFTERLLGDAPDDFKAWTRVNPEGTAALSGERALAWRARHVAVLDFADETSAPGRAGERARPALEALSRALVARLPGKPELPLSVALLPKRDGGPVAIRFEHEDLFGIVGLGAGAVARYTPGGRNAPLAVLARSDDDQAKDVLRTLRRTPGSRSLRGAPYEALGVSIRDGDSAPRFEWLFGRKRNVVFGIGRESERLDRAAADRVRHGELMRLKALLDDVRF